jgi:NitT/TauT family transport system permease protein
MALSPPRLFKIEQFTLRIVAWGDIVVFIGLAGALYAGVRLAQDASTVITGPVILLSPRALPLYAGLSVGRMTAAYLLSFLFTLIYGYSAARNRRAERVLLPILDVLQSVPILSFLPVVLLSLSAVLPQRLAAELASIVLIFTSQAWNMTFAWYQSLITVPKELREASRVFNMNAFLRFRVLELPFAAISLIWNSMMSWSGGWFFLMAAEIFSVGQRDFRLPGLGAYLHEAANQGNITAILWGIGTLMLVIVALDQLLWRPLLAWSDRFKLEMVEAEKAPTSWFYDALLSSHLVNWFLDRMYHPFSERLDTFFGRTFPSSTEPVAEKSGRPWLLYLAGALGGAVLVYGAYGAAQMLFSLHLTHYSHIGLGVLATLLRVVVSLCIAFAWTVPLGVAIGTNPRVAAILQPLAQIAASLPATALFPVVLLFVLGLPGGLNLAAILLMLMGTQWYLLFNIIAGAAAIPQDLKYTAVLLHMSRWERWRTLILPALFPYIITGGIAASGGAWNASIVAEYVQFGGRTFHTVGIGSLIAEATEAGNYPLLLAATLSMIFTVVVINRFWWRRLYRVAEENYRME